MKLKTYLVLCVTAASLTGTHVSADSLQLRDGKVIQGTYLGGTAEVVRFRTEAGVMGVPRDGAAMILFTPPPPPPPVPAAAAAVPSASAGKVTVPAGTILLVRVLNQVSSNDRAGTKFAAVLETDLTANGVVAARAGTKVFGEVQESKKAGHMVGKAKLSLGLTDINIGGTTQPILTSDYAQAGDSSFKKTARNTIVGTAVGSAWGEAGKGAAVGAGASAIRKGDSVTVPANAILEFRLVQPLAIAAGN